MVSAGSKCCRPIGGRVKTLPYIGWCAIIALRTVPYFYHPHHCGVQGAQLPAGSGQSPAYHSAPNSLFKRFRCSGRLILQKQSTGLSSPKRSTFRASPLRVPQRTRFSSDSGVPVGLFAHDIPQDCPVQNARTSGLRSFVKKESPRVRSPPQSLSPPFE